MATATCQHCAREFCARPYLLRKGWGKFCSRACSDRAAPRSTIVCQHCARPFTILTSDAQYRPRVFCSRACQRLSGAPKVARICAECQQSFLRSPFEVARGRGIFCSLACHRRAHRKKPISVEHRRTISRRADKVYARRHPDRIREKHFRQRLQRYRLTPEDYDTLMAHCKRVLAG